MKYVVEQWRPYASTTHYRKEFANRQDAVELMQFKAERYPDEFVEVREVKEPEAEQLNS